MSSLLVHTIYITNSHFLAAKVPPQVDIILNAHPLAKLPEIDRLTRPDKWQHWYRGKNPIKNAIVSRSKRLLADRNRERRRFNAFKQWILV